MSALIDTEVLGQLRGFIKDKFEGVVQTYIDNSHRYVVAIQEGFEGEDVQAVVDAAHPFKSSSGNMGMVALHDACERIEYLGHEVLKGEANIDVLRPLVESLEQIYQESMTLLKKELP